jgi:hypothetical protein
MDGKQVVLPLWLICTRAAVALKPDIKTLQHRSSYGQRLSVHQAIEYNWSFLKALMNAKGASSAALLAINRPYVSSNYYCCKSSNSPIFFGRGKKICDWTPPNQGQTQGDYGPPPSTADLRKVYYDH